MKVHEYIAPSSWASYLINNDASGLEPGDKEACDAWCKRIGMAFPSDAQDVGFKHQHDARLECPYAADCQKYTFLVAEGAKP